MNLLSLSLLAQLLADRARLSHSSAVKVQKRAVCGRALFHKVTKSRCGVSTRTHRRCYNAKSLE